MDVKELVICALLWMVFGAMIMFCWLGTPKATHRVEVPRVEVQRSSPCHWAPMIAGGHP